MGRRIAEAIFISFARLCVAQGFKGADVIGLKRTSAPRFLESVLPGTMSLGIKPSDERAATNNDG